MNGEIVIVDEFTGRLMTGRQWSDGLHQAVEAKERVRIKEENQTLATITLQNFFKLYKKLSGMTGTAMTEANEFWKVYKLDVVAIPTNRALTRAELPRRHLPDRPREVPGDPRRDPRGPRDRPADPGRHDLDREVGADLRHAQASTGSSTRSSTPSSTSREAEIVAQAGRKGMVTIATNMAGRGTDIILGGNPEFMAWADLKHLKDEDGRPLYPTRLEVPKDVWEAGRRQVRARDEGRGARGRRRRRPAHHRDRAAREPADRQPAPRPGRPPGRPRLVAVLPLARRRPDAEVRRRVGLQRPGPARDGGGRGDREQDGLAGGSRGPRRRSRSATSTPARTCSNTTRSWTSSGSGSTRSASGSWTASRPRTPSSA